MEHKKMEKNGCYKMDIENEHRGLRGLTKVDILMIVKNKKYTWAGRIMDKTCNLYGEQK